MNEDSDMATELFIAIPKKQHLEYWLPPKTKEDYLKDLESCKDLHSKPKILDALIHIYRADTIKSQGHYSVSNCNELIGVLSKYADDPSLSKVAALLLVREGSYCEGVGDFPSALKFYEKSLSYTVEDADLRYFRLNNLAFCLNYLGRFKEAEPFLREAINIVPTRHNAHKNLGVCLEHQGQIEQAARYFYQSTQLCKSDPRPALHLTRLMQRHPALRNVPELANFYDSYQAGEN
jgi:tetratricopeptide (TPR) repeat protein